jgi:hypothetical protein
MEQRYLNDISWRQFLNEDKFMGSKCKKCGALYFPPRPICPQCYSTDMEWAEFSGRGKLAGYTFITVGPAFMAEEGFDRNHPYCLGVMELEEGEGLRAVGRLEGVKIDTANPPKIEMPLKVKFLHRGEGERAKTFLAFEPA